MSVGRVFSARAFSSAAAVASGEQDYKKVLDILCTEAEKALAETPEMLPVLKEAGVVDAGGRGLLYILEGMRSYLIDGVMIEPDGAQTEAKTASAVPQYAYALRFTVHKTKDAESSAAKLKLTLESVGGEAAVEETADKIAVQVQSDAPHSVLEAAFLCGSLHDIEIVNLADAPNAPAEAEPTAQAEDKDIPKRVEPEKEYGFVAVAAGEGLCALFQELGEDQVVSGGQTMNPSTDDILNAVEATPARHVFVLPNNKNIIMAAEQTVNLADRGVSVLSTRTIPQGITAMLSFDESLSPEENHLQMMKAAEGVHTAQVTFAARDSEITLVDNDSVDVAYRVTRRLIKKHSGSIVTILYGEDTDEAAANALCERLQNRFPNVEYNVINGGQPVYYFMVSVE